MEIRFEQVLPAPLVDSPLSDQSCWNTSFALSAGSCVSVTAPSGTGKSTLLSIIYGLRHDYSGTVFLEGENIRHLGHEKYCEWRKNRLSMVFQELRLFPQLSAKDNVMLKLSLTNSIEEARVDEWFEALGLGSKMKQTCGTLSLGQQQRVALIRALVQPFSWLLLDEPFSHLDESNSHRAIELIRQRLEENKAGLLVTGLGNNKYFEYTKHISV